MVKRYDVFISYNSKDREQVIALAVELKNAGLIVWLDQWELRPGKVWQDSLDIALSQVNSVLVCIGPAGIGPWQAPEVYNALSAYKHKKEPIIPVILNGVNNPKLPPPLSNHTWVDCRDKKHTSQENLNQIIWGITGRRLTTSISQMGEDFSLSLRLNSKTTQTLRMRTLPNTNKDSLLYLSWQTFGQGIDILIDQIRNVGCSLGVNACIGINDAGLVMATFISSKVFRRTVLGYYKCGKEGENLVVLDESFFPNLPPSSHILICDFEVKSSNNLNIIIEDLEQRYENPTIYYAVFGALTKSDKLEIKELSELVSAEKLKLLKLKKIFIACTMSKPGIEPPLDLR